METSQRSRASHDVTCSAEEPLARGSARPDCEVDWMIRVLHSPSLSSVLQQFAERNGSCGRTFQDVFQPTEDGTSGSSSKRWAKSGIASHGECWTHSTCEHATTHEPFPNDASVCSLSDIITQGAEPQYYLTPKACAGILRRIEGRSDLHRLPKEFLEILERESVEHYLGT